MSFGDSERRAILREVGLVFGLSLAGCWVAIGLGRLVPFVGQNLHAFVAVLFLALPAWALGRRGQALEDVGLNGRGAKRALAVAALACAATFPPYVVGHHFYQEIFFQRHLSFEWSNYAAFPEECASPPPGRAPLSLACWRDEVRASWRGPLVLEARGAGIRTVNHTPARVREAAGEATGAWTVARFEGEGGTVSVRVPPGGRAVLSARRGGAPLPPAEIEIGAQRHAGEQPVELGRGWWWMLELLLAQLIAVALPEEVFYRGYIQGRLAAAFPRRRRILGAEISVAAVLATSVLFALGHFLLDLNPARLGVFFPSLVFGWIRAHASTLAGCIVYHALCNVLVRFLIVHY